MPRSCRALRWIWLSLILLGTPQSTWGFTGRPERFDDDTAIEQDTLLTDPAHASPQQRGRFQRSGPPLVFKDQITPHWFDGDSKFWYRNDLAEGTREFIVVDAASGERAPAFDHKRLAESLGKAASQTIAAEKLPFETIALDDHGKTVRFKSGENVWKCGLDSYECKKAEASEAPEENAPRPERGPRGRGFSQGRNFGDPENGIASPDGAWTAVLKDHNIVLRKEKEADEIPLSTDGKEGFAYDRFFWSPDSKSLVAFRVEPGDHKKVYLIQSSPPGGGRAKLEENEYALPGDKFDSIELNIFKIDGKEQIKPKVDRIDFGFPFVRWNSDGSRFTYQKTDRGHQRFRVIEVEAKSGEARNLIDEQTSTFIWTAHTEGIRLRPVNWLEKTNEIIYVSERDGWRHLYLIDAEKGEVKNQITKGEYVVRGIDLIDEAKREIWFTASGKNPDQDPYFLHSYKVNFDGTGLVALTEGNGNHSVQFSPDRAYLIDTYSRVDTPPVHTLRKTSDGSLVCKLEEADISALKAQGWQPLEVFSAKGRDGKTDIWGVIARPKDFDPSKKYPVVESIYAGPQDSYVPKSFSPFNRYAMLTDLGFVVVQIDGMGTANRSKAFHDVCWHNLKDAGFPDRVLWHKAVAEKYPFYDLARVGLYGTSAGGQNAAGGVLFYPDFYKAAAAACGCHDNRMDKASWNEQWMGYPVGPWYGESSNIDNAHRLKGKLLLIVGELDHNVPPESTFRLADALIRAKKDFELVVVPNADHGMGGEYGARKLQDFFVRNLLRQEPPDRNAEPSNESEKKDQSGAVAQARPVNTTPTPGASSGNVVSEPTEDFFKIVHERDRDAARKFYKKLIDVDGMAVVASAEVADEALVRTRSIVTHMLAGRPDVVQAMIKSGMYLIIIGKDQVYTDMPEYRDHPDPAFQNERVRGTGGLPTSFGEENLLSLPIDRYDDESIAVHEFAHTIDGALRSIDDSWRQRLNDAFKNVREQGLYKYAYAAGNPGEYWAEIVQSYFHCNRVNNWNHGPIGTRDQLKVYDPIGYELVRTTLKLKPEQDWRYTWLQPLPNVTPPPERFKIDPYYTKFTWAREFPVLGRGASDAALLKANDTIRKLFAYRHDILKAFIGDGVKLVVLGPNEKISDLPEYRDFSEADFDPLARFLDYSPATKTLVIAEENVLADPSAPGVGENQLIRIMARAIVTQTARRPVDPNWENRGRSTQQYELRVKRIDVTFDERLGKLFDAATADEKWRGTAAARDRADYFAAGVLAYFDAAGNTHAPTNASRPIVSRDALKTYDPALFDLVDETMAYDGHVDWRFSPDHAQGR